MASNTEGTTIRSGILYKPKPRFFVLRQTPEGRVLTYYAGKESKKERGRIAVADIISITAADPHDRIAFGQQVAIKDFGVGTIRYFGPNARRLGDWVGVQLYQDKGNMDGSEGGVRYFDCDPNHGILVPPQDLLTVQDYTSLGDADDKRKTYTFSIVADPPPGQKSRSSIILSTDNRADLIAWMLSLDPNRPDETSKRDSKPQAQKMLKRISGLTYDETPDDFEDDDYAQGDYDGDDDDGFEAIEAEPSYVEIAQFDELRYEEDSEYIEIGPADALAAEDSFARSRSFYIEVEPSTITKRKAEPPDGSAELPPFDKQPMWCNQPHVVSANVAKTLSKMERRRQETIFELVQTEEQYFRDVTVLKKVLVLPLEAHRRSCEFSKTPTIIPVQQIARLIEVQDSLQTVSKEFLAALRKRQQEAPVVAMISDVIMQWSSKLCQVFYDYSEVVVDIRDRLDQPQSELRDLLKSMMMDPAARSLPIDAFILSPVQRLARYPLLIQGIVDATDYTAPEYDKVIKAQSTMAKAVQRCNTLMCKLQDELLLRKIEKSLDYGRLSTPMPLVAPARSLLKRGLLDVLTISGKRISKSRALEFFLFTDMVMFGKPVKHKKTGERRYLIFKQVHRSHFEARDHGDLSKSKTDKSIMEMLIFEQHQTLRLYTRAASSTDKRRWLEAFNPPKDQDQVYFEWDCPKARVIKDYEARQTDEMSLRVGETINILSRGSDGWNKGALTHNTPDLNRNNQGWYPIACTQEVASEHAAAKALKSEPSQREIVADVKHF